MLPGNRMWAVLFMLIVSGCSNNNLLMKRQLDMADRLDRLSQENVTNGIRLKELSDEVNDLRKRETANGEELARLKSGVQELKDHNEGVSHQEGANHTPQSATRIVVVNKAAAPGDPDAGEQDAYMKAFGLYSTNRFQEAIDAFSLFLAKYPASDYAVNAQYWIGECYYSIHDFTRAIEEFNKVSGKYPQGKKVPDAMLKVGFALISLNEQDRARAVLEALVKRFPQAPASAKARERLDRR